MFLSPATNSGGARSTSERAAFLRGGAHDGNCPVDLAPVRPKGALQHHQGFEVIRDPTFSHATTLNGFADIMNVHVHYQSRIQR